MVQRFLIGAESDAEAVMAAIDGCVAEAGDPGPPIPPDARGAVADAVDRFFDLLAAAYARMHEPARSGHRRDLDDLVAQWQPRLDEAATDVEERAKVLAGRTPAVPVAAKRPWGTRDRPGCALGFVVVALVTAAALVWAVLHGWPAEPVSFGF